MDASEINLKLELLYSDNRDLLEEHDELTFNV
jgi:hypothetical protein